MISNIANIRKIKLKYENIFLLIILRVLSLALVFILFVFPCFIFSSTSSLVKPFNSFIILFLYYAFLLLLFSYFLNLKAFKITVRLLNTIAKLAIIGFIEIPKGFNTPMAIGIIKQL